MTGDRCIGLAFVLVWQVIAVALQPGLGAEFAVGERPFAMMDGESTVDGKPAARVFRGDIFVVMQVDGDLRLIGHPDHTSAWVDVKMLATLENAKQRFADEKLRNPARALELARECERTKVPDLRPRARIALAAAHAAGGDFDAAVKAAEAALAIVAPEQRTDVEAQLAAYRKKQLYGVANKTASD